MEVMNRSWCHLSFYCKAHEEMLVHHIPRSSEYWHWLEARLTDFYTCIVADIPPDHLTWPPLQALYLSVSFSLSLSLTHTTHTRGALSRLLLE